MTVWPVSLPIILTIAKIIGPIALAFVVNWVIQRLVRVPKHLDSPRTQTYLSIGRSGITMTIYAVAVYTVFMQLDINLTPLFASAGVIGIIIGLGVRSFIEDFFTGLFILTQDTISVGDHVEIGGSEGIAEEIGFRTVRIKDQNGAIHIFPNREIKKIVNYSRRTARVIVDIPVKSNQSVNAVFTALTETLTELRKDKTLGTSISEGSRVQGVEQINAGSILIRVLILTSAPFRWEAARKFRYLALMKLARTNILLA